MSPPVNTDGLQYETTTVPDQETEERCFVFTEQRFRVILSEYMRITTGNEVSQEHIDRFVSHLEEPPDRQEAVENVDETDYRLTPEHVTEIRREGRILAEISDTFCDSVIRQKITQVAMQTDLRRLDYNKFCQIMADMKRNEWIVFNEGMLIVMFLYFKDLMSRALEEGEFRMCYDIVIYFFKYMKESGMVMVLKSVIGYSLRSKYAVIASGAVIASCVAFFLYTRMR